MKNRNTLTHIQFALLLLAAFGASAVGARAQNRDQYVVSAKAGGVNFISGDVTVQRRGANRAEALTPQDSLDSGDGVTTGAGGRIEVLLVPGSYLRVSENSQFELTDSSLESLRVKLARGSAIVEAAGLDDARSLVAISTRQATVTVDKRGLYRINTRPDGTTEVFVRKGRALVTNLTGETTKVEGGKMLTMADGHATLAKFDKKLDRDAFDSWSSERGEALAAANRNLSKRALANSYASYRSSLWGRRYGIGSYSGLWLYDPLFGGHTFLPFYTGLSSPYGHGYAHSFGVSHTHFSFFGPRSPVIFSPHAGTRHITTGTHGPDHFGRTSHPAGIHHQSHRHGGRH